MTNDVRKELVSALERAQNWIKIALVAIDDDDEDNLDVYLSNSSEEIRDAIKTLRTDG